MKVKGSTLLEALFATLIILSAIALVMTCSLNVMRSFNSQQVLKAEMILEAIAHTSEELVPEILKNAERNGIVIKMEELPYLDSDDLIEVRYSAINTQHKELARYRKIIQKR